MQRLIKSIRLLPFAFLATVAIAPVSGQEPATPAPEAQAEIGQLIIQLESDQYRVRQRATRDLARAGMQAASQ
ncbi:MAG: hypothetical protein ACR2NP_17575, partial [Pirellulaceae bacterium]